MIIGRGIEIIVVIILYLAVQGQAAKAAFKYSGEVLAKSISMSSNSAPRNSEEERVISESVSIGSV